MHISFNRALALILFLALSLPSGGQTSQTQSKPKAGTETNCDGVLEIVPRKEMSFVRKRRPKTAPEPSPNNRPHRQDAKPVKEPTGERD